MSTVLNKNGRHLNGAKVLVLGVAYKKDVDDDRESPAYKIIDLLQQDGAKVSYNDPHIPRCFGMRHYPKIDLTSIPLTRETLQAADLILLVTDHSDYDYRLISSHASLIVDTRNAFRGQSGKHIYQA